ncbi:hypothetical protein BGW39_003866 [Mortierella sp. 14UC]|nr:hypothetical protein BGW39_003866 [Mortierella sp. 14UC]
MDDETLAQLLSKTPRLTTLLVRENENLCGVKDMPWGLHRLYELGLLDNPAVTVAIMSDENNDNDSELFTGSVSERQSRSCYKTLKRLDIRELGVVDLGNSYAADDPRIEQNREAFRRIRRRVRMLPALKNLTVECLWSR